MKTALAEGAQEHHCDHSTLLACIPCPQFSMATITRSRRGVELLLGGGPQMLI
jgi:hypothetical protein